MKKSYLIFTIVTAGFILLSGWIKNEVHNDTSLAYSEGDRLQSFTLPSTSGDQISLEETLEENRIVWVNFWATWCGPCRREMPIMSDLYEKYRDKGFTVIAISVSEDASTVKGYLNRHPVPFTVLLDSAGHLAEKFNIKALPTSFLIDSTGKIKQYGVGVQQAWNYYLEGVLANE